MELTGYASIARRWWRRILAATFSGAIVGLLAVPLLPPTYEATAKLLIGPVSTEFGTQRSAGSLARTYADLILTRAVLDPVARQFSLDVKDLVEHTKTTASEATRFVTIVVEDSRPAVAAEAANAMVAKLVELAGHDDSTPEGAITVVETAQAPPTPSAPSVPLVIALTTATGFVSAMLILILVESFSRRIRDEDDIARLVDVPVVGSLQPEEPPGGTRAADLALITARLVASSRSVAHVRVAVTGIRQGAASARVAARVVAELAAFGGRVAVIDTGGGVGQLLRSWGDIQHGRTITRGPEALVETIRIDDGWVRLVYGRSTEEPHDGASRPVDLRPTVASREGESIATSDELLAAAEDSAGITVIHVDYPASSAAALRWIETAEDAVVVVGLDESRREDLHRTVEVLRALGVGILGIAVVERRKFLGRFRGLRLARQRRPNPAEQGATAATRSD